MSGDDLRQIEAELGITLPEPYKRLMVPFPLRYLRGNADTDLWDDPDQLLTINRELRTEFVSGHRAWPAHWFFIGDPLTACGNAIDLRDPAAPVLWVDHCDIRSIEGASGQPFEQWLRGWTATIRADLEKDGIDANGDPPTVEPLPRWKRVLAVSAVLVLVGVLGVLAFISAVLKVIHWLGSLA